MATAAAKVSIQILKAASVTPLRVQEVCEQLSVAYVNII